MLNHHRLGRYNDKSKSLFKMLRWNTVACSVSIDFNCYNCVYVTRNLSSKCNNKQSDDVVRRPVCECSTEPLYCLVRNPQLRVANGLIVLTEEETKDGRPFNQVQLDLSVYCSAY